MQSMGRIVAIDYGMARLGIALSDEQKIIVAKSFAIKAEKKPQLTAQKLQEALAPFKVEKIIVGLPLHLDGNKSTLSEETLIFVSCLETLVSIPVISFDERLTTKQAERILKEGNLSRKKRAQLVDAMSATVLLECYLDYLSFNP